ncbi:MAG TPA: phosphohistidine phosphatase SixA [Usitatibacteraceae bacterium]
MQIILWRHAEAEDHAPNDLARRLTAKGQKQAEAMARWLKQHVDSDLAQWRIISSPAVRTQQTAAALELHFATEPAIAPDNGSAAMIAVAGWPDALKNVLVVGHQPTLGMVAAQLLNGAEGYVSVKKGAIWWFESRRRDGKPQTVLRAMATPESIMM